MTTALELALQNYAEGLVTTYVKNEYDNQIKKWQEHINVLVDEQHAALERVQNLLNDVQQQMASEADALRGFATMALGMVGGVALSWIAGTIQYTLYPKYASTKVWTRLATVEKVAPIGYRITQGQSKIVEPSPVWGQVYGDLGKTITGLGMDKAIQVLTSDYKAARDANQKVATADNHQSFKTLLENAMLANARLTSDAIMSVGMGIHQNIDYGSDCLKKLRRIDSRARDRKVNDRDLQLMAMDMINKDVDALRQQWANDWLYYGNDPGSTMGVSNSIELELWGLWILNENLKLTKGHRKWAVDEGMQSPDEWVAGATFPDAGVPGKVLNRLADFGVVEARTMVQKVARRIADAEARERNNRRAVSFTVREKQPMDSGPARARRELAEAIERDALQRERDAQEQKNGKRQETEQEQELRDRPRIKIVGWMDKQEEIDALESWAKNHSPKVMAGQLKHTKRTLVPIKNIAPMPKVLPGN
jgi:hypothetical protein